MSWLPKTSVVVPFDFSDHSLKALRLAREFVDDPRSLHVIHVLSPLMMPEPGFYWGAVDDEARRRHAENAFREAVAGDEKNLNIAVRIGDSGREIATFAAQVKAELIVMPSHGRTGLTRVLIGSVAERVLRLAHCPVLILR